MAWMAARSRRRTVAALVVLAIAAASALSACRPPSGRAADGARSVEARLLQERPRVGEATVEVDVRASGAAVDGARVRVTGDMTHAGMVPVVADAVPVGGGRYRSTGFVFTMPGDWVITVDVVYPDGATREVALPVAVSR